MKKFIEGFSSLVKGTITGFDRIVFKGFVLPYMAALLSYITYARRGVSLAPGKH